MDVDAATPSATPSQRAMCLAREPMPSPPAIVKRGQAPRPETTVPPASGTLSHPPPTFDWEPLHESPDLAHFQLWDALGLDGSCGRDGVLCVQRGSVLS